MEGESENSNWGNKVTVSNCNADGDNFRGNFDLHVEIVEYLQGNIQQVENR